MALSIHAGKVPYLLLHVQLGLGIEQLPALRMRIRSQSAVPFLEQQCRTQVLGLRFKTAGFLFFGQGSVMHWHALTHRTAASRGNQSLRPMV